MRLGGTYLDQFYDVQRKLDGRTQSWHRHGHQAQRRLRQPQTLQNSVHLGLHTQHERLSHGVHSTSANPHTHLYAKQIRGDIKSRGDIPDAALRREIYDTATPLARWSYSTGLGALVSGLASVRTRSPRS